MTSKFNIRGTSFIYSLNICQHTGHDDLWQHNTQSLNLRDMQARSFKKKAERYALWSKWPPTCTEWSKGTLRTSVCQLRSPVSIPAHSDTLPVSSAILCQVICPQLPSPAGGTNRPLFKGIVLSPGWLQILGIIDSEVEASKRRRATGDKSARELVGPLLPSLLPPQPKCLSKAPSSGGLLPNVACLAACLQPW